MNILEKTIKKRKLLFNVTVPSIDTANYGKLFANFNSLDSVKNFDVTPFGKILIKSIVISHNIVIKSKAHQNIYQLFVKGDVDYCRFYGGNMLF